MISYNFLKKCEQKCEFAIQSTLLFLIKLYRAYPKAPCCRFVPSCSEYAQMKLQKCGLRAIWSIIWRVLRCNPFARRRLDL